MSCKCKACIYFALGSHTVPRLSERPACCVISLELFKELLELVGFWGRRSCRSPRPGSQQVQCGLWLNRGNLCQMWATREILRTVWIFHYFGNTLMVWKECASRLVTSLVEKFTCVLVVRLPIMLFNWLFFLSQLKWMLLSNLPLNVIKHHESFNRVKLGEVDSGLTLWCKSRHCRSCVYGDISCFIKHDFYILTLITCASGCDNILSTSFIVDMWGHNSTVEEVTAQALWPVKNKSLVYLNHLQQKGWHLVVCFIMYMLMWTSTMSTIGQGLYLN